MNMRRFIRLVAVKIDPVWPTPQDCWHRHPKDNLQPIQPQHLMQLTPRSEAGSVISIASSVRARLLYLDVGRHLARSMNHLKTLTCVLIETLGVEPHHLNRAA